MYSAEIHILLYKASDVYLEAVDQVDPHLLNICDLNMSWISKWEFFLVFDEGSVAFKLFMCISFHFASYTW